MQSKKQQNQHQAANYEDQNKELRELYQERKRKKQQQQQENQNNIEMDEEVIEKKIKQQEKEVQPSKRENIFLNMLVYDKRANKPDFFIKMFSLFNQDPKRAGPLSLSKNIQSIFITTFGFQIQTFQGLLDSISAPIFLINHSDNQQTTKVIEKYHGYEKLTVILPKKASSGYGVFHTKLWLIKFNTFLRVVVSTSNQHLFDWAIWQNAYWYQDFPLKKQNHEQKQFLYNDFDYVSDFRNTLAEVLKQILPLEGYLQNNVKINLSSYSYNDAKVILVPSIPGKYDQNQKKKQGLGKVKQVMKKLKYKIQKPYFHYCSTSLGIIKEQFVKELWNSFSPNSEYKKQNFKIIYPTKQYIETETCQEAQVLFLMKGNYNSSDFTKDNMCRYDTNPKNPILGCIPHLKVLVVEDSQNKQKCMMYLGSHNMTKAAWGSSQKSTYFDIKDGKFSISNSELGLIFIDYSLEEFKTWSPFQYPPEPYRGTDSPYFRGQ